MRKTDKKIDNQLRVVLTDVCETALKEIDGFQWLTHKVNYSNFPHSLKIVCIFDSNELLAAYSESKHPKFLLSLIQQELSEIGIKFKNMANHVIYDTEENCSKTHDGNWANRLA